MLKSFYFFILVSTGFAVTYGVQMVSKKISVPKKTSSKKVIQKKASAAKKQSLKSYQKKRKFDSTPEPSGSRKKSSKKPLFVIQKHAASHLHYDFRLEHDGVLISWAIPKGPSTDPDEKHLAVMTEDHPLDYATFEGVIPKGNYGAGTVMVWDIGTYDNAKQEYGISMKQALADGKIEVDLHGTKLNGKYALIRTHLHDDKRNWLFFKMKEDGKVPSIKNKTKSALSERTMAQITKEAKTETNYGKR
jgi:bifunctional non-homologous end joining protein LigD